MILCAQQYQSQKNRISRTSCQDGRQQPLSGDSAKRETFHLPPSSCSSLPRRPGRRCFDLVDCGQFDQSQNTYSATLGGRLLCLMIVYSMFVADILVFNNSNVTKKTLTKSVA